MSRWSMIAGAGISVLVLSGIAIYVVMSGTGFDTASSRGATAQGIARYRAGGLEVGITTVPATPRVGDNRLMVELRTPDGEPVPDVEIEAYAEMPAMGAMPAMRARSAANFARGTTRSAFAAALALDAVPSRTRPTMPCRIPARRNAL